MGYEVFFFGLLLLILACSPCYQQGTRGSIRVGPAGYVNEEGPPQPFQFSYNNQIHGGSTSYHQAQGDETGKVRGTYGYTDEDGLHRIVEYEADANGYRATIRTNEPGTEGKNPADVIMMVEPVPQAVLNKYARAPFSRPGDVVRDEPKDGGVAFSVGYGPPPPALRRTGS